MILFLLVSFMCFGEEKTESKKSYEVIQREEIDFLKTQLIKSNNKIDDLSKKIEKLEDKGEKNLGLTYNVDQIYQNSVQYYDSALEFLKWIIGGMLLVLGYLKWDGNKKYEKERKEITKEVDKRMERMLTENAKLKEKAEEQEKEVERKTLELYETIEQTNKEMNEKLKEVEYNTELAIAINKSKNEEKIEELKKLVKKYPEKTKVYFELGSILIDEKNYEEAMSNFNIIKKLEPKNGGSYNVIGIGYEILGLNEKKKKNNIGAKKYFEEAIKNYELAMKLNPNEKLYVTNKKLAKKKLKELEGK